MDKLIGAAIAAIVRAVIVRWANRAGKGRHRRRPKHEDDGEQ